MRIKRTISLLTVLTLIILSMSGCKAKDNPVDTISDNEPTTVDEGIDEVGYTIPYLRADTLNPFEATEDINKDISTLLYDSLYSLDNTFKASNLIAESYTQNEEVLSVTIKSGIKFTDGSYLTASDVVYSFKLAKKSDNYSSTLYNISDAEAVGDRTIIFTTKSENIFETSNLTFPIIKTDSDNDEDSSDEYSVNIPIGSGRYSLVSTKESRVLKVNKSRLGGYHPKYNTIGLKDVTEATSIPSLFSVGGIDYYTSSLSDGTFSKVSGTLGKYSLTNFVYIGINSDTKVLSDSRVKRAIALIINRNDMAAVSFAGYAIATSSPFHPSFYATSSCTMPPIKTDVNAGISLLEEAGFDQINTSDVRYSNDGSLSLKLVVNKENGFKVSLARNIQQALEKAGINVTLREYSYSNYVTAVKDKKFDLYIGETKLTNSFELNKFFKNGGGLDYGIDTNGKTASAYSDYKDNIIDMQGFIDTFADNLPFIPLVFRQGMTAKSNKITNETKTIVSDSYYNINEWTIE